jgi:mono/diheme cytochrome c family protein
VRAARFAGFPPLRFGQVAVVLGVGFVALAVAKAPSAPVVLPAVRAVTPASPDAAAAPAHFADADDLSKVLAGKALYQRWCAACHGRRLQGQALWQLNDQYSGRRAPAHDQTGHTWAHSDDELFFMTRQGRFPGTAASAPSYMPAFGNYLTDQQIIAVLAFIKANWSIGLRISQALLNPGNAGMPVAGLDNNDWTLPPNCVISSQRWRTTSR